MSTAKSTKAETKTAKTAAKRTRTTKRKPATPSQSDIARRAYFIHLEDGAEDQVANWFRAERELTAV